MPVVTYDDEQLVVGGLAQHDLHEAPDLSGSSVLERISNQFTDDYPQFGHRVGWEAKFSCSHVHAVFAVVHPASHRLSNLTAEVAQVLADLDRLNLSRSIQAIVDAPNRDYALRRIFKLLPEVPSLALRLQMEHASRELQAVRDAVIDLSDQ